MSFEEKRENKKKRKKKVLLAINYWSSCHTLRPRHRRYHCEFSHAAVEGDVSSLEKLHVSLECYDFHHKARASQSSTTR